MNLSKTTDYGVRVCLYLAAHQPRTVPISEIATAFDISRSSLLKVAQRLVQGGYAESVKGRSGGLTLAKAPHVIKMGELASFLEGNSSIVDCASCILIGSCGLIPSFRDARRAFYKSLDKVTLAEAVMAHPQTLNILRTPVI